MGSVTMKNKALQRKRSFDRQVAFDYWDKINNNILVQCPTCGSWHKISLEQKFSSYVLPIGYLTCSDCKAVFSPSADNVSLMVV